MSTTSVTGGARRAGDLGGAQRARDGVWSGELTIPKGAPGGLWNVSVALFDRANYVDQSAYYVGQDAYADQFASSGNTAVHELAGARFTVLG
jgi:hypothetical protein